MRLGNSCRLFHRLSLLRFLLPLLMIVLTAPSVLAAEAVSSNGVAAQFQGGISGTVTDAVTGEPFPTALVTVTNTATGEGKSRWTDSSGFYLISGLVSGGYKVSFASYRYCTQWSGGDSDSSAAVISVSAPDITTGINATMVKLGSITGTIADENTGAGIAGAHIFAIEHGTGAYISEAYTDINGSYTLNDLDRGSYHLRVLSGYSSYLGKWYGDSDSLIRGATIAVTPPNATTGVVIMLQKGGGISGRVTDAVTGAGIPNPHIHWYSSTNIDIFYDAFGGNDGSYTIGGLVSGDYLVYFSSSNYRSSAPVRVTVSSPGITTGIDATLTKGGGIGGRTIDSRTGEGIAGVLVEAYGTVTGYAGQARSNEAGYYMFDGVASDTYKVTVSRYGDGRITSTPVTVTVVAPEVTTASDLSVVRHRGSISGTITDAVDGSPIHYLTVVAFDMVSGRSMGGGTSDSSGNYTITGLPPGVYKIQFQAFSNIRGGYLANWYHASTGEYASGVTVSEDGSVGAIDGRMARAAVVQGNISFYEGPVPKSVNVRLYDAASDTVVQTQQVFTGNFFFRVAPGRYKLEIDSDDQGFLRQWFSGKRDAAGADIITVSAWVVTEPISLSVAQGGGSISGRITSNGVCYLSAPRLKLYDYYSGALVTEHPVDSLDYAIRGIPDGTYKLLYTNGASRWYRTAESATEASPIVVSGGIPVMGIDNACMVAPPIAGDCDGDGTVAIAEVQVAINMFLGMKAVAACVDVDGDGQVGIAEVQKTINGFLGL